MGKTPGSFCLVAVELDYIVKNGGIGTTNWWLVHLLARHGWRVHVLYCCPVPDLAALQPARQRLAESGIGFTHIDELPLPSAVAVPDPLGGDYLPISERVRFALEELHRRHTFDLVEFAEVIGAGFRAIQAKRAGLAFADVGLLVKLHSMSQWLREGNSGWMTSGQDLMIDYCERRAFEQADFQLSPSRHLLDYAAAIGWQVRADAHLIRYPFPDPEPTAGAEDTGPTELVFFGRLETRKGLELFLDALTHLDRAQRVTFLGKDTILDDGRLASELIQACMQGRRFTVHTACNREQALAYLTSRNCLAVLPSLRENYANALIECIVNGVPFVASRVGGMPEIVPAELHEHVLFEPDANDLVRCVRTYLGTDPLQRTAWRETLRETLDVEEHNRRVVEAYAQLREEVRCIPSLALDGSEGSEGNQSLVSVVVRHQDQAATLPQALRSLADQTYPCVDVFIIDDGSTNPTAQQAFAEQESRYPQFRFVRQDHAGDVRNHVLAEARGEFFLSIGAGHVLQPRMIERLVASCRRNPECAAMTCYHLLASQPADLESVQYIAADRPTGGPYVMGSLVNVYGEANGLFRTSVLRSAGGFVASQPDATASDWPTYVRLAQLGYTIGVVPDYLACRVGAPLDVRSAEGYRTHLQVIEQYARTADMPEAERLALWTALVSFYQQRSEQIARLHHLNRPLRYRLADQANDFVKRLPLLHPLGRAVVASGVTAWQRLGSGRREAVP